VALNSGTAALHAATWAIGIRPGDEVIVPVISFVASSNCVLYMGAKPIFADLSLDTLNLDPEDVERRLTTRTKAIVAVDFAGHPCDHDALHAIAERYGLKVIEDAAHSLGATYKGRKVGVLQDMTTLSFHPVKHITTGEGGMVLLNDSAIAKRIRSFRHHGIDLDIHQRLDMQSWRYDVIALGYNYRIPDVNCALGVSQMIKLDKWLMRRREIVQAYREGLGDLLALELPMERSDCASAWHLYVVRLQPGHLRVGRDQVFAALRAENIGVNVHYIPIPWMSHYATLGYKRGDWPVAENTYARMLTLPLFPSMSNQDVSDSIVSVRKVISNYAI